MSETEWDIDKKWKYLYFLKCSGFDGWKLGLADERLPVTSRHELLSAEVVNAKLIRDGDFALIFDAIASDPQLIECSNGLYEACYCMRSTSSSWRIFPCFFNRNMWRQFSHFLRIRVREQLGVALPSELDWMTDDQLRLAKRLSEEALGISDTAAIDNLLSERREWSQ